MVYFSSLEYSLFLDISPTQLVLLSMELTVRAPRLIQSHKHHQYANNSIHQKY